MTLPEWAQAPGPDWDHFGNHSDNEIVWSHPDGTKRVQMWDGNQSSTTDAQQRDEIVVWVKPRLASRKYTIVAVSIGAGCTLALDALLHLWR